MKSWIKTLSWSVAMAIAFTTTTLAQIASDNAGNYSGTWTNESNGGTGFGAWVLTADAGTGSAGFFTGDPASATMSRTSIPATVITPSAFLAAESGHTPADSAARAPGSAG
ncbi:MAG: hypothetical protein ACO3ZG_09575, partial [Kiritimatiellia bacterium]